VEKVVIDDKQLIMVSLERSLAPHHTFRDKPFIRMGPTTNIMPQAEYQHRLIYYRSTNKDYSSVLIKEAKLSDLDNEALTELKKLLTQSGRYKRDVLEMSTQQLLTDLNLIQGKKLTLAALLILGSAAALSKFIPHAEIRYGYRISESEIRNQDTEIFIGGYFLYYKRIWEKIDARNITVNIPDGMLLRDKKAFDEQTIREAINNAIIHRDYTLSESSFIIQYPTCIEIKSPGGFPEGITIANIMDETKTRNKLLADVLFRCEVVEQFGSGINLMYKNQLSLGKNPPDFSKSKENNVLLNIDGTIQDIDFAKYVMKVAQDKKKDLNDQELLVLNKIKNNQKITTSSITKNLLELSLIENIGHGKYMLSRTYYSSSNQKGVYTRIKGLENEEKKRLILKHLQDFDKGYKHEFRQALSGMTDYRIYKLLKELENSGQIEFIGHKQASRGKNQGF